MAYETTSDDGLLEAEAQFVIYFSSNWMNNRKIQTIFAMEKLETSS